MKTMKLGKTDIDISRMGLGTWSIGGGSAWGGDHDLQVVVDTIREAPSPSVPITALLISRHIKPTTKPATTAIIIFLTIEAFFFSFCFVIFTSPYL
jgi:hypothetical protein